MKKSCVINKDSTNDEFLSFLSESGRVDKKTASVLLKNLINNIQFEIIPDSLYEIKEVIEYNGKLKYELRLRNGFVVQTHYNKQYLQKLKERKLEELRKDKLYELIIMSANTFECDAIKKDIEKKIKEYNRKLKKDHLPYVIRSDRKLIHIMYYMDDDNKYFSYDVLQEKYCRYDDNDLIHRFKFDAILSHQQQKDYNNVLDSSTRNKINKLSEDFSRQFMDEKNRKQGETKNDAN